MNRKTLTFWASLAAAAVIASAGSNGQNVYAEDDDPFDLSTLGVRGDINGDGTVDVMDQIRYKRSVMNSDKKIDTDYQSDINSDGKIDINDAMAVQRSILKAEKIWSHKNIPVMDGSTSAIPLEAGFKSRMLGINYTDAKKSVKHHKTHESFQMLLSGKNDMIFTVPISESQQKDADEAGVHLNLEPVAKEGFVFVVNKNNPVDSLTQQQIRDIYSGRITNWSEVGGNDEKIIPYQRNNDSGSQNYMVSFMEGYKLMTPPEEYRITGMGTLMDAVVASYNNSKGAIGYSVYSYAAQMYENSSDVKFISVDGIKPSRETMSDSTYPLLSSTYIMYTDDASEDTLDFVKWASSEEGQLCVLENGYVPVMEMEYPDRFKLYHAAGTGREKPADYKPDIRESSIYEIYYYENAEFPDIKTFRIDFLKDKDFQNEINADIVKALEGKRKDTWVTVKALNGYLSVIISEDGDHYYDRNVYYQEKFDYDKMTILNYDLINSRKIDKFSDLFYKGTDFVQGVNDTVSSVISKYRSEYLKTDFLGITDSVESFSIDNLRLKKDNPYLNNDFLLNFNSILTADNIVTGVYFDLADVCDEKRIKINYSDTMYFDNEWESEIIKDKNGDYKLLITGSRFHTDEEIADKNKVYDRIFEQMKEIRDSSYTNTSLLIDISERERSICNFIFACVKEHITGNKKYLFDPETGEMISLSDIFGDELKDIDKDFIDIIDIDLYENTVNIEIMDEESGTRETIEFKFDPDRLNKKYISDGGNRKSEIIPLDEGYIGEVKWTGYDFSSYDTSYIAEGGPEKQFRLITGPWRIQAKEKCCFNGQIWYNCYDPADEEYYGWLPDYEVSFYHEDDPFDRISNVYINCPEDGGWSTFFRTTKTGVFYGESYKTEFDSETFEIKNLYYSGFSGTLSVTGKTDERTFSAVLNDVRVNNDRAPYERNDLVITEKEDIMENDDEILIYMKGSLTSEFSGEFLECLKEYYNSINGYDGNDISFVPEYLTENVIYNVTKNIAFFDRDGSYEFTDFSDFMG